MNIVVKKIAIYGAYMARVPVRQRYWIRRRDGVKQRYWKKTKRLKKAEMSGRYEFHGKSKDLYKSIMTAHHFMPKGFVDVSAVKFLEHPERYGFEGEWVEREVVS